MLVRYIGIEHGPAVETDLAIVKFFEPQDVPKNEKVTSVLDQLVGGEESSKWNGILLQVSHLRPHQSESLEPLVLHIIPVLEATLPRFLPRLFLLWLLLKKIKFL